MAQLAWHGGVGKFKGVHLGVNQGKVLAEVYKVERPLGLKSAGLCSDLTSTDARLCALALRCKHPELGCFSLCKSAVRIKCNNNVKYPTVPST